MYQYVRLNNQYGKVVRYEGDYAYIHTELDEGLLRTRDYKRVDKPKLLISIQASALPEGGTNVNWWVADDIIHAGFVPRGVVVKATSVVAASTFTWRKKRAELYERLDKLWRQ